jgi:hypothetical protein
MKKQLIAVLCLATVLIGCKNKSIVVRKKAKITVLNMNNTHFVKLETNLTAENGDKIICIGAGMSADCPQVGDSVYIEAAEPEKPSFFHTYIATEWRKIYSARDTAEKYKGKLHAEAILPSDTPEYEEKRDSIIAVEFMARVNDILK